jgi:hypothetical protein
VITIVAEWFDSGTRAEAASRAGVGVSTFYGWLQLGRSGHPAFAPLADAVDSVEHARQLSVTFGRLVHRRRFWKAPPQEMVQTVR